MKKKKKLLLSLNKNKVSELNTSFQQQIHGGGSYGTCLGCVTYTCGPPMSRC
ncbi:class I lanthipeptide [Maribacter sp.]